MGFDCFEEVEQAPEPKQEQEVNLDKMKKAELEKFAEENGFEIEGAPTKAELIQLLKAEIK